MLYARVGNPLHVKLNPVVSQWEGLLSQTNGACASESPAERKAFLKALKSLLKFCEVVCADLIVQLLSEHSQIIRKRAAG